jgi:class 3 adenylate cyclase
VSGRWLMQGVTAVGHLPSGTVTLLFSDIERSTQLLRRVRGRYAAILAEHQRLLRAAFERGHGREIDTQGDSFFVAFRTARDAVAAAVAAQRALAEHPWPDGVRLRIRIGLHTAEPEAADERYVGLGVHRAARICSAAHGGQILISDTTRGLLVDDLPAGIGLRNLGAHRLKDFDHPEQIYQLLVDGLPDRFPPLRTVAPAWHPNHADEPADLAEPDDLEASNATWIALAAAGPFVGRTGELRAIQDAWSSAASGSRVLVLLGGEPGIGKTALAAEAARRFHGRGALVLHGRWDEEVLAPYQAFREALGEYARACPRPILQADLERRAGEISRLFPEVVEDIGALDAPLPGAAEAERLRLFEALDGWMRAMASRRPVLIVLDDLHWADRPSLLLTQHLMRSPHATPLLVLATYRDIGQDQIGLAETLSALARDTDCRRVAVRGLTGPDVLEMLRQVGGGRGNGDDRLLAQQLEQETGGNAFFLREILRHLVESGALPSSPQEGRGRGPSLQVPQAIRDVVNWRLNRLSRQCLDALSVACVIGQEFEAEVLGSATGIHDDRLIDLLEEAGAAGLINESPDEEPIWVFSHAVVRRVLLDGLSRVRGARLHRRVAESLEVPPRTGITPARLAHHYCASASTGSVDKAVRYARMAGDRALEEAAFEAAVQQYRNALQVLERYAPGERVLRCELLLLLGGAHDRAGEYGARDECFVEAAAAARTLDRVDLLTQAALGYGGVLPAAVRPDPKAPALVGEALERLGAQQSAARARLLARLAHWLHYERPYHVRLALSDESVAMAGRVGDPETLAATLVHRCWALDGPDDVGERLAIAARVVRLGEDRGDQEAVLQGLRIRLLALLELGHFESAVQTSRALAGLANRLRHPEYLRLAKMWDVVAAAIEGRHDDAERFAEQLHTWLQQISHPQSEIIFVGQTFSWRWLLGRSAEYLPIFEAMAATDPTTLVWPAVVAWCHAELGAPDRVREVLRAVTPAGAAAMDKNYLWWGAVVGFSRAAASIGDREWAEILYRLALPFAAHNCTLGLTSFLGAVAHHLGVLAGVLGRWDAATAHFEAALERHLAMGARPYVALTQQAYADVLVAKDGPSDRERAHHLRQASLRTAEELKLPAIQARTWPSGDLTSPATPAVGPRRR